MSRALLGETLRDSRFWRLMLLSLLLVGARMAFRHLDSTLPKVRPRCRRALLRHVAPLSPHATPLLTCGWRARSTWCAPSARKRRTATCTPSTPCWSSRWVRARGLPLLPPPCGPAHQQHCPALAQCPSCPREPRTFIHSSSSSTAASSAQAPCSCSASVWHAASVTSSRSPHAHCPALAAEDSILMCVLFVIMLSIGEAVYSPATYLVRLSARRPAPAWLMRAAQYSMLIAPKGKEGLYTSLSAAPLFMAKVR